VTVSISPIQALQHLLQRLDHTQPGGVDSTSAEDYNIVAKALSVPQLTPEQAWLLQVDLLGKPVDREAYAALCKISALHDIAARKVIAE
jgi:hypothetical protein